MTTPNNLQDWGRDFFLQEPEFGYLGALGQKNMPKNMADFFRGNAGRFLQRYNEALSQQVVGGQLPTLNPFDFFSGASGQFTFENEFAKEAPTQRGFFSGRFAPNTRFLFR